MRIPYELNSVGKQQSHFYVSKRLRNRNSYDSTSTIYFIGILFFKLINWMFSEAV